MTPPLHPPYQHTLSTYLYILSQCTLLLTLSIYPPYQRNLSTHPINTHPLTRLQNSEKGAYGAGGTGGASGGLDGPGKSKEDRPRSGSRGKGEVATRGRAGGGVRSSGQAEGDNEDEADEDEEEEEDEDDDNGGTNEKKGNNWGRNPGPADNNDRGRSLGAGFANNKKDTSNGAEKDNDNGSESDSEGKMPSTRGSRCFEILGFDVMIDRLVITLIITNTLYHHEHYIIINTLYLH